MKTLNCWLIANIGIIGAIAFILTFGIGVGMTGKMPEILPASDKSPWLIGSLLSLGVYGFGGGYPAKNFVGDLFNLVLLGLGAFLCYAFFNISGIAVAAVGLIGGILCAIYTAANFYEVVSVRMIYASSNTALFETNILYTFNRFIACAHAIFYEAMLIAFFMS